MKKFKSYKRFKMPHYPKLPLKLIRLFLLIFALNFGLNVFLTNLFTPYFFNLLNVNAFGNVVSVPLFSNLKSLFFKNAFGLSFDLSKNVIESENNAVELETKEKPLVYIYNTFQTAKYKNNYYNSYNVNPLITQASSIFAEYLKSYGINSLVETKSVVKVLKENNIAYSSSYQGSKILLNEAYNNNPTLEYFFDIQLSDNSYEETTITIDNEKYAQILFVIGLEFPTYEENLKFATDLATKINSLKNITKDISKRGSVGYQGIYNEDFSKNTLLIQIGGRENTIDEVNRTLKVLASAFDLYLKEQKYAT